MNGLQIFVSEEFGNIRTVTIDNEPWFVGKDVAEALGYERTADAIRQHIEADDKGVGEIQTPGGTQRMAIINESGLYALIFGSRLESAKRFKRWVTAEVLPALRRTGTYSMDNYSPEMQAILMHDTKIVNIEHRMDKLENEIPMYGIEADELSGHVKRKGVAVLGGKKSNAYKDNNVRSRVYRDIYEQLKREFGIYADDGRPRSYKALQRKYLYDAHELIDAYEPPIYIQEMIDNANSQIRLGDISGTLFRDTCNMDNPQSIHIG